LPIRLELETLAEIIDALAVSVFLLDGRGRLVHANMRGQTLLADGRLLRVASGRLAVAEPKANEAFRHILLRIGRRHDEDARGRVPLATRDGERFVANLLPLAASGPTGGSRTPLVAVFVCRAALDVSYAMENIGDLFALTPTERRVLRALIEVGGSREIAAALEVSKTTVKAHLHNLFAKTGAKRQADLVRLVGEYSHSPCRL
jgi:DNA-binding CsgD family transcriptional regulator